MLAIHRTRQLLIAACIGAVVLVAIEFPLKELLAQRSQIAAAAQELSTIDNHNAALSAAIKSLSQPSQIAAIAHQEYGLVQPGQRSYVILPSASSKTAVDPVAPGAIPVADLGATGTSPTSPNTKTISATTQSLWHRFINRLEFWH